jgi:hypothetical protein
MSSSPLIGLEPACVPDLANLIDSSVSSVAFDYVVAPLVHPRYRYVGVLHH